MSLPRRKPAQTREISFSSSTQCDFLSVKSAKRRGLLSKQQAERRKTMCRSSFEIAGKNSRGYFRTGHNKQRGYYGAVFPGRMRVTASSFSNTFLISEKTTLSGAARLLSPTRRQTHLFRQESAAAAWKSAGEVLCVTGVFSQFFCSLFLSPCLLSSAFRRASRRRPSSHFPRLRRIACGLSTPRMAQCRFLPTAGGGGGWSGE